MPIRLRNVCYSSGTSSRVYPNSTGIRFEQEVLATERKTLLRRIFFESSSPLRSEADNWFLRELRGRYDVVLKFVARNPGCMHNELVHAIRTASGSPDTQIGGYLRVLIERFGLIERKVPVFSKPEAKRGRYYLTDNFLRAWLAALSNPVSAVAFRPLVNLIQEADQRLADVEGRALEKLAGQLYEERSRKQVGDFPITHRVQGYWDKSDTEIDLVAVNEMDRSICFGSCKHPQQAVIRCQQLQAACGSFSANTASIPELEALLRGYLTRSRLRAKSDPLWPRHHPARLE